jgi:hypothetical protein
MCDEAVITSSALYKTLQQQLADANSQAQGVLRQLAEAQTAKHEYLRLHESKTQQAEVRAGCLAAGTYCCSGPCMCASRQQVFHLCHRCMRAALAGCSDSQLYLTLC